MCTFAKSGKFERGINLGAFGFAETRLDRIDYRRETGSGFVG
jgi:hypothetical protein